MKTSGSSDLEGPGALVRYDNIMFFFCPSSELFGWRAFAVIQNQPIGNGCLSLHRLQWSPTLCQQKDHRRCWMSVPISSSTLPLLFSLFSSSSSSSCLFSSLFYSCRVWPWMKRRVCFPRASPPFLPHLLHQFFLMQFHALKLYISTNMWASINAADRNRNHLRGTLYVIRRELRWKGVCYTFTFVCHSKWQLCEGPLSLFLRTIKRSWIRFISWKTLVQNDQISLFFLSHTLVPFHQTFYYLLPPPPLSLHHRHHLRTKVFAFILYLLPFLLSLSWN